MHRLLGHRHGGSQQYCNYTGGANMLKTVCARSAPATLIFIVVAKCLAGPFGGHSRCWFGRSVLTQPWPRWPRHQTLKHGHGRRVVSTQSHRSAVTAEQTRLDEELNRHAEVGDVTEANRVLRRMLQIGAMPAPRMRWNTLLKACANAGRPELAMRYYQEMLELGIEPNLKGLGKLQEASAKVGQIEMAEQWAHEITSRFGATPENSRMMIDAAAVAGNTSAVEHYFKQAKQAGIQTDAIMLTSLMDAAAKRGDLKSVECWMNAANESGVEISLSMCTTAIDAAARSGAMERARSWLTHMRESGLQPDVVALTAIVHGAAKKSWKLAELWVDAFPLFAVEPNMITYNTLISAAAKRGELEAAQRTYQRCLQAGFQPDVLTFTGLVIAAGRSNCIDNATWWFRTAVESNVRPDKVMMSALIDACARGGHQVAAKQWVDWADAGGIELNEICYGSLIAAAARVGNLPEAEAWFATIGEKRLVPRVVQYTQVIKAASAAGDRETAEAYFMEMAKIWGAKQDGLDRKAMQTMQAVVGMERLKELCRAAGIDREQNRALAAREEGRRFRNSLVGASLSRAEARQASNQ